MIYDSYDVTGVDRSGKRFKKSYSWINRMYAFGINLWRGSVWGVKDGKRTLLKRVVN